MDTMRERFASTASRLLDEDPRLAVVLAVIGHDGFREAERRHPHRVIDVGIREQLLVGVGAGIALTGMRPLVHTFASFLVERPFEQVKLDFGHQGVGGVLVSAGGSYDWPAGGFTHMSPGDVALLDALDGWTVHVPGHPDEAEALLRHAAKGDDRVYVRLSLQTNARALPVTGAGFLTVREGNEGAAEAVIVEPYLAGTSAAAAGDALADVPHRVLGLRAQGAAQVRGDGRAPQGARPRPPLTARPYLRLPDDRGAAMTPVPTTPVPQWALPTH